MAFGKRKNTPGSASDKATSDEATTDEETPAAEAPAAKAPAFVADSGDTERPDGPFDIEDFDDPADATTARLDLGSVLIPMPPGGQVQVELNEVGVPSAIWVVTPNGRFTIAAYAAPKSPGLWREVAAELADSLRNDNAAVSIEDGPWGREVVGAGAGVVRFIGVDGYRWMIRCVVNGAPETIEALAVEARDALTDTVVRRGDTAMPVRTPLPVELPEPMAAQLREAAAQQAAMLAAQQAGTDPQQPQETAERRSAAGSAMQQLRSTSTGG